jgi:gamma-glutamyltranspeptidase/glutathione hydrolase
MYSEQTAEEVKSNIEEIHTLNASSYDPDGYGMLTDSGTSAAVTSDRSGLMIAITSTVNTLFGSQLMVPETGVIMNNEMNGKIYTIIHNLLSLKLTATDFSIPNTPNAFGYIPTEANSINPFKRPLSSISSTIVEFPNGTVYISHASACGSRIITEVAQHLWYVIDQNMTSAESLAQPRMHDQLSPNSVSFELASPFRHVQGYSNETAAFMKSIWANITFVAPGSTTAQALRRLGNGTFEAAGDPRNLNSAGYAIYRRQKIGRFIITFNLPKCRTKILVTWKSRLDIYQRPPKCNSSYSNSSSGCAENSTPFEFAFLRLDKTPCYALSDMYVRFKTDFNSRASFCSKSV